jgi:hypothetical protein
MSRNSELHLNVNSRPALVADERNYVIEIRGVNRTTLWTGDLLYTVFRVGPGRSWDPYFEVTALNVSGVNYFFRSGLFRIRREFGLARRILRARNHRRTNFLKLDQVLREDQVKGPVESHTQLLLQPRKFA